MLYFLGGLSLVAIGCAIALFVWQAKLKDRVAELQAQLAETDGLLRAEKGRTLVLTAQVVGMERTRETLEAQITLRDNAYVELQKLVADGKLCSAADVAAQLAKLLP